MPELLEEKTDVVQRINVLLPIDNVATFLNMQLSDHWIGQR
jgi:hypothetical protein